MADQINTGYFSYLLRIWKENGVSEPTWRISLENPASGKRTGFSNLQKLMNYLEQQISIHDGNRAALDQHTNSEPSSPTDILDQSKT
jgi:hypothetical protein